MEMLCRLIVGQDLSEDAIIGSETTRVSSVDWDVTFRQVEIFYFRVHVGSDDWLLAIGGYDLQSACGGITLDGPHVRFLIFIFDEDRIRMNQADKRDPQDWRVQYKPEA